MYGCTNYLGEAKIFSTMNANAGYRKIKIAKKVIDKTALVAHNGLWLYTKLLFGLKTIQKRFKEPWT